MRRPFKLVLAAAAAAITTAARVTAASAAPTATHAAAGTEYFQVMSTATAPGPASVIARGVFAAAGRSGSATPRSARSRSRAGRSC